MSHKTQNLKENFNKEHFGRTLSGDIEKAKLEQPNSSVKVEAVVIAKPEDCKGCFYNWDSLNTQPEDSYCYMFNEFMVGCKKYKTEF